MRADPFSWQSLGLARSYALASFPIVVVLMVGLGWWVTRSIETQVIKSAAANVALYVQSFLTPALQDLEPGESLSPETIERIDWVLAETPLGARIRALKIWQHDGLVGYYSRRELIGRKFPVSRGLRRAWAGEVAAGLNDLSDEEDAEEARLGIPLLEVYSPVRGRAADRIVAVVEFYQDAQALEARLRESRVRTWLVVVLATLTTFGLLFGIVVRGGGVIKRQREELSDQVACLTGLLAQNEELTDRVRRAARRTTEINERLLRQVGAELHDGPAQSISLALLRLDSLTQANAPPWATPDTERTIDELRTAVQEEMDPGNWTVR